ncbi:MAG: rRNA maturation RNase YbeY [Epulopiscium sp. Nele67-Bin001]|nr:MAG: rRNA maturation RNase YbeY [Epulopiscium sp. Nuni2H_MBin001]OON92555.1 MAG: rRNA maturation RNase YbeY [Epulopiscium sp. Nele67-Bin001]
MLIEINDELDFLTRHPNMKHDIEMVIEECLRTEDIPCTVEVSLSFVDKNRIQELNKEHRNIDRPTDVLSFPLLEDGELDTELDTEFDPVLIGDIVVCEQIAIEQAQEYGHSIEREVCFLVAHSMFHLLGYDHMDEGDETVMRTKQNLVLDTLGISR